MNELISDTLDEKQSKIPRQYDKRNNSDEYYVLDLCDELLGKKSKRQYTFDFLRGDGNPGKKLPVDAYYPDLKSVIEYRERQHTEPVKLFDNY